MIQTKLYSDLTLIIPEHGSDDPILQEFSVCRNFCFHHILRLKEKPLLPHKTDPALGLLVTIRQDPVNDCAGSARL